MLIDLLFADNVMQDRVKDALHETEQARLVKMVRHPKGIRSFLRAALQHASAWWDGGNGASQPATEHMRPWKKASKT